MASAIASTRTCCDEIASKTHSVAEYVEPKEDIEQKISSFYSKASYPVLSGVKLAFGDGLKTYDMYPREMPDLFKGSQLLVFGRYNGYGDFSVTLEWRCKRGAEEICL